MTPNYIDFVCFCLFVFSMSFLIKKFYAGGKMTKEEKDNILKEFTGLNKIFLQCLTVGWVVHFFTSFYYGFLIWLTYESFFKVLSFLLAQKIL